MRDPAVPALAALLLALAVPAALGAELGPWPTAPEALGAALVLLVAGGAPVVLGATRHARPLHVLDALLVAAPLAAAVARAAPAPLEVPWAFAATSGALALAATASAGRARALAVALAGVLLGALPAADAAGVAAVPAALRAPTAPLPLATPGARAADPSDLVALPWRRADPSAPLRPGALVRTPGADAWPAGRPPGTDARWVPVPSAAAAATLPRGGVVVGALGAALGGDALPDAVVLPAPRGTDDPRDLDAFDVLWVGPDTPDDPRTAEAVASFVRRGGLAVLSESDARTPASLRRALGAAAPSEPGPAGARPLGGGRVARAPDAETWRAVLAAGAHRPRFSTVFRRALEAPAAPGALRPRPAEGAAGRASLRVACAATAVLGLAALLSRRRRTPLLLALALVGVGYVALGPATPRGPAVEGFVLECGGVGGTRVEGVLVVAGPAGFVADLPPAAPDAGLRMLGFRAVRAGGVLRCALPPGGEGWVLAETSARGLDDAETVAAPPAWAEALFDRPGDPAAARIEVGTSALDALAWPGVAPDTPVRAVAVRGRAP